MPGRDFPSFHDTTLLHSASCAENVVLCSLSAAIAQNEKVRTCQANSEYFNLTCSIIFEAEDDSELSNQRKAQRGTTHDYLLDTIGSNLDSDMAHVGASCVQPPGVVSDESKTDGST
ncbi:hypothetical protein P9112_001597 [Eukaryota sp. TZLM1-RC]